MEEWNGRSKIFLNGEIVFEKEGVLTTQDVFQVKLERGLGSVDVRDLATGKSLSRSDFPRGGNIEIIPVYKPGMVSIF